MNPSRDKFIVEELFKECWHSDWNDTLIQCPECHEYMSYPHRREFDTYEGFGKLWRLMRKDEKLWDRFYEWYQGGAFESHVNIFKLIDSPSKFADAVGEFLKG